ncbi:MAG: hypothetical protein AAB909_01605, partial [Patescibacteria group bacterium]
SRMFRSSILGFSASGLLALSHWHLQYSKKSVETISLSTLFMVGLACFYKGLKRPAWLILSGLFFGLASAAYSPGKLFVPMFLFVLFLTNFSYLKNHLKHFLLASLAFLVIFIPVFTDGIFGKSGTRFSHVSVFTDPTTAATVDSRRLESILSSGIDRVVGLSPRLVDKILINKPEQIGSKVIANYMTTLGTEYLFLKGDTEPRHSPSKDSIGMLQLIDILPFVLGIVVILSGARAQSKNLALILFWLLLAPIPSALTRDGGGHAARTFIMLPALIMIITLGHKYIFSKSRILYTLYLILYTFSTFFVYGYYFTMYRTESAKPYQWGFDWAIQKAVAASPKYDHVYVDGGRDTLLMAYLFNAQKDPATFQKILPLQDEEIFPDARALRFGNIYFLAPGTRRWTDILGSARFEGNNLVIASGDQPLITDQIKAKSETLYYPGTVFSAFHIFTK